MSTRFAQYGSRQFVIRGPFLQRPGNFSSPKANFEVKTCKLLIVAQFLAHKPVNFASLTFILPIFQNYWNFDLECKHGKHKTAFRARKVIGTSRNGPHCPYYHFLKWLFNAHWVLAVIDGWDEMEQNATDRTNTTRFGGKSVCRWTGTGSACVMFAILNHTYIYCHEVYLQITRYKMTQSSCKRDTKSESHPGMKLAPVRIFSRKHPLSTGHILV